MWKDVIEQEGWLGRYVAVWAFNWIYRGRLKTVSAQVAVLEDVHAVEDSGLADAEKPKQETAIPSNVMVSLDAIEQICIPTWADYDAKLESVR